MKKGFTLIEMLSVVLVVAILTAVAVPQYRRSVERTRLSEAVQTLPAIYDAVSRYYVAKPVAASDVDNIIDQAVSGPASWSASTAIEKADTKTHLVIERMAETAPAYLDKKKPVAEEAPALPEAPFVVEKEDAAVTFAQLDLNLKGKAGEEGNVWLTPNFEYRIQPLLNGGFSQPYFVAAKVKKGKYQGTKFAYTGSKILCTEPADGKRGACKLMGLEDEAAEKEETLTPDFNPYTHVMDTEKQLETFEPVEESAVTKDTVIRFKEAK